MMMSLTPAAIIGGVRQMYQDLQHNTSALILIAVLVGIFTIGLVANYQADAQPGKPHAGTGSASGVVHREGMPPIPPPSEIVALRIYPIKSCRGFEIDTTRLRKSGLTLDRNWMFIGKEDRKFLTIRSDPSMTLVDTRVIEDKALGGGQQLEVSIHGTDGRVVIPAFPTREWLEANTTLSTVEIWEAETDAWEYGDAINKIFSDFFRKPVALVYKGPTARLVGINGRAELYGAAVPHNFGDVMSLQIASEASIKDLNARLGHAPGAPGALTIERFRPNIVIRGRDDHPWEEDTWKRIRISTSLPKEEKLYRLDLDVVARCARCQVPNVNPDTADKDPRQPWDMLMKFRRVDTGGPAKWKPCFGMMCVAKNEGIVKVGASLEVLETTDRHLYNERRFSEL